MSPRLDIPTLFAAAGIPLDADVAMLEAELERRGWRVQLEEPLHDDVRRGPRGYGNRYRALAFRVHPPPTPLGHPFSDHVRQTGASAEEALRKVLAAILSRPDAPP